MTIDDVRWLDVASRDVQRVHRPRVSGAGDTIAEDPDAIDLQLYEVED